MQVREVRRSEEVCKEARQVAVCRDYARRGDECHWCSPAGCPAPIWPRLQVVEPASPRGRSEDRRVLERPPVRDVFGAEEDGPVEVAAGIVDGVAVECEQSREVCA